MTTNVNNFFRITIPQNANVEAALATVGAAVLAMTKAVGGCSVTEGSGVWYDDDGNLHAEPTKKYQWNYTDEQADDVLALASNVVDALLRAGELAVFYEEFTVHGYEATIDDQPMH